MTGYGGKSSKTQPPEQSYCAWTPRKSEMRQQNTGPWLPIPALDCCFSATILGIYNLQTIQEDLTGLDLTLFTTFNSGG